jgi:hypothetical protein
MKRCRVLSPLLVCLVQSAGSVEDYWSEGFDEGEYSIVRLLKGESHEIKFLTSFGHFLTTVGF